MNSAPAMWRLMLRQRLRPVQQYALLASVIMASVYSNSVLAVDEQPANTQEELKQFTETILPLLRTHCFDCHSHESGESGGQLLLDSLAAMTSGGTRGNLIADSESKVPLLLRALNYEDADLQMPPDGKLDENKIEAVRMWLAAGSPVPESFAGIVSGRPSILSDPADHWAYQPISVPDFDEKCEQNLNPIDCIVRGRLNDNGLQLSPRADSRTLLRRLSLDLTGLPPLMDDYRVFLESLASDARSRSESIKKEVDRLLASPHFGEKWARHWMDVARYADNKGYVFQEDREYKEAYKYRDWLVASYNKDLPYDQFVTRQLAADLDKTANESDLPALGYLTLGRRFLNNKHDITDDRLDVTARGLMGMTLTCARCHDHKYDPISQKDYYALAGVFLSTKEPGGAPWEHRLTDSDRPANTHVLLRGVAGNRGDLVARRFVSFLSPEEEPFKYGSGRLELAKRIVDPKNPLTTRVYANRVWTHLMGTSLVSTPSDFGLRCEKPIQQELLNYLAWHLVDSGWSTKDLIRLIVTSDTYQQSSIKHEKGFEVDPSNSLYWRMNRKRLEFETYRDTLLFSAGCLDSKMGGPSVPINSSPITRRRTIYSYIDRQNLPSIFRTFDMASPDSHTPNRSLTSVPQQGLYLLNSDFMAEIASIVVKAPELSAQGMTTEQKVNWLVERIFARPSTKAERVTAIQFLHSVEDSSTEPIATNDWLCGFASFDPQENRLSGFQSLPHFTGNAWQGGKDLPDATLGWCMISDKGGHPGNDLDHAVVRRWIAPASGRIRIRGMIEHPAEQGDGVRATIMRGDASLGQWLVHHGKRETRVEVLVELGDRIDFVTDCVEGPSHDSFVWKVQISQDSGRAIRSELQLPSPRPKRQSPWEMLAQALLATNELAFVD